MALHFHFANYQSQGSNTLLLLLLLLLSIISPSSTYRGYKINILVNGQSSKLYKDYSVGASSMPYSTLGQGNSYIGHLFEVEPRSTCSQVPPPPPPSSAIWFLLVSDYPTCPLEMVNYTHKAGYSLVIGYGNDDNAPVLTKDIFDTGFPVVSTTYSYGSYLKGIALSSTSNDPITLRVYGPPKRTWKPFYNWLLIAATLVLLVVSFSCACFWQKLRRHCRSTEERTRPSAARETRVQWQRPNHITEAETRPLSPSETGGWQQQSYRTTEVGIRRFIAEEQWPQPFGTIKVAAKEQNCVICADNIPVRTKMQELPCGHRYHIECIKRWLSKSNDCPLCRKDPRPGTGSTTAGDKECSTMQRQSGTEGTTVDEECLTTQHQPRAEDTAGDEECPLLSAAETELRSYNTD